MLSPDTERTGLILFLDWQRQALIRKVDGLTEQQARSTPTVSALSLLGIIRHSAFWERRWFQIIVAGRTFPGEWPESENEGDDDTFRLDDIDTIETVVSDYRLQIDATNEILSTVDPDAPCAFAPLSNRNVRWVAMHLVEETARHAGHADIIRESIDGVTGR